MALKLPITRFTFNSIKFNLPLYNMADRVDLKPSQIRGKKYTAIIYKGDDKLKTVHFGQFGASDFTKHKNEKRKQLYIQRHEDNEKWGKEGITTSGFWAKHLLWNKPTIESSKKDIESRFGVKIN